MPERMSSSDSYAELSSVPLPLGDRWKRIQSVQGFSQDSIQLEANQRVRNAKAVSSATGLLRHKRAK